jgi:hypothetical protein
MRRWRAPESHLASIDVLHNPRLFAKRPAKKRDPGIDGPERHPAAAEFVSVEDPRDFSGGDQWAQRSGLARESRLPTV